MAQKNNHLVIMAGGVGSRFWPMSTAEKPKQFIDVLGVGKTLLQLTVERFNKLVSPENIWVVTNQKYVDIVREQLPEMPAGNILCEPCRRNTAPCIAYVSWRI
jgi:mannose-1-phosphate guanylyltransferase